VPAVADFINEKDNGIVKKIFLAEYQDIYQQNADGKYAYYFATGKGTKDHQEKEMTKLILQQKEELLSLDNKIEFIFAHTSLGVGWDNPNIFNICFLRHIASENNKKQFVGRGLRLCINNEGDNLQVLKLLKKSYKNMVKCIYIDPPYNTGNEFVYNDKFELDINKYLTATGEIDADTGEQLADYIKKDDGKKHSKWLSFMYPRLMAARELLREDGVIFISIDDHEMHNLRHLMNEIFGERNFVGNIIWLKKNAQNDAEEMQKNHEYILCFKKDEKALIDTEEFREVKVFKENDKFYYETSGFVMGGGAGGTLAGRPNLGFTIYYNPKTKDFLAFDDVNKALAKISNNEEEVYKNNQDLLSKGYKIIRPAKNGSSLGCWKWSIEKFNIEKEKILIKEVKNGYSVVRREFVAEKDVKKDEDGNLYTTRKIEGNAKSIIDLASSGLGTKELKNIFKSKLFDNPKSIKLIKHLLQISTKPGDLVLDFFAGSGTTGQAVMELNYEEVNKRNQDDLFKTPHPNPLPQGESELAGRRFILVQLPEKIDNKKEAFKAGYHKISDITVERVKRASEKYQGIDNGFKILQLTNNPQKEGLFSLGKYDNQFIITHLALIYGYGLNYQATKIAEKEIYLLKSEIVNTKDAIIILEQQLLTMQDIMNLVLQFGKGHYKFFTKECALNIELTYNLLQHFREEQIVTI
jgi:adenine-specific DNA-methyltransferase